MTVHCPNCGKPLSNPQEPFDRVGGKMSAPWWPKCLEQNPAYHGRLFVEGYSQGVQAAWPLNIGIIGPLARRIKCIQ